MHTSVHHNLTTSSSRSVQRRTKCCDQGRKIGSKRAVLVIVWTFLVSMSMMNPAYIRVVYSMGLLDYATWEALGGAAVIVLIGPVVGLLASIRFGRYRALHTGLWVMWAGEVIMVILLILQCIFPNSQQILLYSNIGFLIAVVGCSIGLTLYLVNAIPFGLDQMPDASGEQISAFINWFVWSTFAGVITAFLVSVAFFCSTPSITEVILLHSLLSVAMLSFTLCSSFLLQRWLIIEPKGRNPFKTFCRVLRFAAKHKVPVKRSAFTYCETEMPSRLDLAKSKYGGPFTGEEVEDVKTFLRLIIVIASLTVTMSTFSAHILSMYNALHAEFIYSKATHDHSCLLYNLSEHLSGIITLLGLLAYKGLIHPYTRNFTLSTLKRVGLSLSLIIISSLLLLASTTVWYMYTNPTSCLFVVEYTSQFPLNREWVEIPYNTLLYTLSFVFITAMLEFICAQAPYILRGLLIGVAYSVLLLNAAIGAGVYIIWKLVYQEKAPNSPSCGVWFYLFTTITATLGCVLWCAVAKWYKRRERDEPDLIRLFAENYYDH